ncbi:MAG TPA: hypothetical protein VK002_10820 [Rubricoccaceae bacterium]|jgi:hypothetical protein|nr:hypothetical protein [Rubricoccaceae bacterium]
MNTAPRHTLFPALLFAAVLAGCSGSRPDAPTAPGSYTVLDAALAEEATRQCSRASYAVEGGWNPSEADVRLLEEHLPDLLTLPSTACCLPDARLDDLGRYHRQYVGVVIGGRRLIYVNAFPARLSAEAGEPFIVCDGGTSFWGALFDPETATFSDLAFNGEA